MTLAVQHLPDQHRFEVVVDGHASFTTYSIAAGVLTIIHTEVPPELGGRGIAGALVQAALDHARDTGLKVRPACSYSRAYMERHPETLPLLA
jgi:predicted GNAT family acetyltransferase